MSIGKVFLTIVDGTMKSSGSATPLNTSIQRYYFGNASKTVWVKWVQ